MQRINTVIYLLTTTTLITVFPSIENLGKDDDNDGSEHSELQSIDIFTIDIKAMF